MECAIQEQDKIEKYVAGTNRYDVVLIRYLTEIVLEKEITERVRTLRYGALYMLRCQLEHYSKRGYIQRLLCEIAEKKCKMIMSATTRMEMDEILRPGIPKYDGSKFIPGKYYVAEEELICWSEISLRAPLKEVGVIRYSEVFRTVFPKERKQNITHTNDNL